MAIQKSVMILVASTKMNIMIMNRQTLLKILVVILWMILKQEL